MGGSEETGRDGRGDTTAAARRVHVRGFSFFPKREQPEYGVLFCVDDDGEHSTAFVHPRIVKELARDPTSIRNLGEWRMLAGWPHDTGSDAWRASREMFLQLYGPEFLEQP